MNSKNFIFYSEDCPHSKKLLEILNKNNISDNFELCSVDNSEIKIPEFVKCVPTLYLIQQKRILIDESLFHYINIEINKQSTLSSQSIPPSQPQPQQLPQLEQPQQPAKESNNDDISGYHMTEMGSSFSDNYSFINDDKQIEHSYSFINENNSTEKKSDNNEQQTLPSNMPKINEQENNNKSALIDKAYEEMMKQRGSEMKQSIGEMRM